MVRLSIVALLALPFLHDGPDPIGSWLLTREQIRDGALQAVLGVDGRVDGAVGFVADRAGGSLLFDGRTTAVVLADDHSQCEQRLPKRHLTVDAWVAINTPTRWGGILGVIQDNGGEEAGWVLGYDGRHFTFGLASKGADDGDGRMTYLAGRTAYREGLFHHVCATFDGEVMRLYVDGKLDGESNEQSGDVLYPERAPLVIGGYRDRNERHPFHGRLHSVRLFEVTAGPKAVAAMFEHGRHLQKEKPHVIQDPEQRWVVRPYLQWGRQTEMTVCWETSRLSSSRVHWTNAVRFVGEGERRRAVFEHVAEVEGASKLHHVPIRGLQPDTAYYYRVETTDDQGRTLLGDISSFQTAPADDAPFAFAVISDTQGNPSVSGRVAEHAWALRPHFLLHPGDLVSTGSDKSHWLQHFFASMEPMLKRIPMFPVLGNHEQDARFYYDYMALPAPEYCYTFTYGNAQFVMLDSNREVGKGSEQYRFAERTLRASRAEWKIVCCHHPAYSSDENDYGDAWHGPSTRGDLRIRELTALWDEHGVDIVWNGHIHSYERTWPLRDGKARQPGEGTVYMVTGGGGGGLETAGPIRPHFQNTVRRGHHFCYVAVNGKTLEIKAYDLEGQLFDTLTIQKR